jgi:hypothetical protein
MNLTIMWLGLLTAFSGQTVASNFPACQEVRIPSPDHQWMLVSNANPLFCPGTKQSKNQEFANDLSLINERAHDKKLVLKYGTGGDAIWAPDSAAFIVNNRIGSNLGEAYLYRTDSLKKLDLTETLLSKDPSIHKLMGGHRYVLARKWLSKDTALVQFCGHTDQTPVVQFDFRYQINLDGAVRQLSRKQSALNDQGDCAWKDSDEKSPQVP